MQIVSRIYKGHTLNVEGEKLLVVNTMKIRKSYAYIVRNERGDIQSLKRKAVLDMQRTGDLTVTL